MFGLNFERLFPGGKLCADPITEENPYGTFANNCNYQVNGTIFKSSDTSLFATKALVKSKGLFQYVQITFCTHLAACDK